MSKARLTDQATQDLEGIWRYIAADNRGAADRLVDKLIAESSLLADHPTMGRTRDELLAGARSFGVGNYLIFYRVISEGIAVIRILHGARDLQAIFEQETIESFGDEE